MDRIQDETNVNETSRPELMSNIWNRRAKGYLAGRILDRIVEERELTDDRFSARLGKTNLGSERALAHLLLHCSQTVLRDREVSVDRIQPLNHQQRIAVAGIAIRTAVAWTARIDDVTNVHQPLSGPAVNRRANVAITKLDLRALNGRRVHFHRFIRAAHCCASSFHVCPKRVVVRSELFVLLARNNALLNQHTISLNLSQAPFRLRDLSGQIRFSLFLQGAVFGKIGLRLP